MASPTGPSAPDPRAAQAVIEAHESGLRNPIHAVEREAHELHETVVRGESGATPAILAGGWIMLLVPIVAIVVGLALGVAYLVTRGDGRGGIATARSASTDELTAGRTGDDVHDLTAKTLSVVVRQVTSGGTSMPAFSGTPTEADRRHRRSAARARRSRRTSPDLPSQEVPVASIEIISAPTSLDGSHLTQEAQQAADARQSTTRDGNVVADRARSREEQA